jgi:hypothetical protein
VKPFYFHYIENGTLSLADVPVPLPSTEEAYLAAYSAALGMWPELLAQRIDPRECAFEVRNEANELLFHFPFSEVLDYCRAATRSHGRQSEARLTNLSAMLERLQRNATALSAEISAARSRMRRLVSSLRVADEKLAQRSDGFRNAADFKN